MTNGPGHFARFVYGTGIPRISPEFDRYVWMKDGRVVKEYGLTGSLRWALYAAMKWERWTLNFGGGRDAMNNAYDALIGGVIQGAVMTVHDPTTE